MGYSHKIMQQRALMQIMPRPTKHPGSKPGRIPASWQPGKGNTFRAVTRSVRRRPGWKKRMRSQIESAQSDQAAIQRARQQREADKFVRDAMREAAQNPPWRGTMEPPTKGES